MLLLSGMTLLAQTEPTASPSQRIDERIRALQREAQQLAGQSRTLLGELRQLEVERDLRTEEARLAEAAAAAARQALAATTARLTMLEQQREAQLPDLRAQLVDIYKAGRSGYARLLFGATSLRDFARATRAVASLSAVQQRLVAEHRATMAALRAQRRTLEEQTRELQTRQARAGQARAAADQAVAARSALLARIDSRRDLTAQYVGELRTAHDRLQQLAPGTATRVDVPLAPFRGALDWPVDGRVTGRFGQADRPGSSAVRSGIDIAAPQGTPARAVHGGTVAFAGPYAGFGSLVILDHGGNDFTVYGYLSEVSVERGQVLAPGAELGRTGERADATPGLYFEVRIDGRSVDPLQWLKPRG